MDRVRQSLTLPGVDHENLPWERKRPAHHFCILWGWNLLLLPRPWEVLLPGTLTSRLQARGRWGSSGWSLLADNELLTRLRG